MRRRGLLLAIVITTSLLFAGTLPAGAGDGWPEGDPDDPFFPEQIELQAIRVPDAWKRSGGEGVIIAQIGNGRVLSDHEDLQGQILPGWYGWEQEPSPQSSDHDTRAAGIVVASTDNARGIAGIAPAARLLPTSEANAEGIRWAVDQGARVIYFEIGCVLCERSALWLLEITGATRPFYQAYAMVRPEARWEGADGEALRYAWERGAVVLAPAGNLALPACMEPGWHENVVCVGAVEVEPREPQSSLVGPRAFYSNFGFRVDILAPGSARWTTAYDETDKASYGGFNGTSAAVAHAAGVAALLLAAGADNEEAVRVMRCTARAVGDPFLYGHGLIDAAAAIDAIGTGIDCPRTQRDALDLVPTP